MLPSTRDERVRANHPRTRYAAALAMSVPADNSIRAGRRRRRAAMAPKSVGLAALLLLLTGSVAGCERPKPASAAASQPALTPVVLSTPQDAARSALVGVLARRAALAKHDPAAADRALEHLRSVAARSTILKRYEEQTRRPAEKPDQVVDRYVESWGSIIGFYADHLRLDELRSTDQAANADTAHAYLPIGSGSDRSAIRIACNRETDGSWRVASIDFAVLPVSPEPQSQPRQASSEPVSQPAP